MFSAPCCRFAMWQNRLISSPKVGWEFRWCPRTSGRNFLSGALISTSQHCWFPWQPGHCLVQFCKYFPKPIRPEIFSLGSQICHISSNFPIASSFFNLPQLARWGTQDFTPANIPNSHTKADIRKNTRKGTKVVPRSTAWLSLHSSHLVLDPGMLVLCVFAWLFWVDMFQEGKINSDDTVQ